MKLPAFQFYPGDWMKDPCVRRLSHRAKGVLIDILCLMHESEERGVLATGGVPWSDEDIALAVGGDKAETLAATLELTFKGTLGRTLEGALCSRRMVRDEEKRQKCSEAGKKGGGNPNFTKDKGESKGGPKGGTKGGTKGPPPPSSQSSSSTSEKESPNGQSPPKGFKIPSREEILLHAAKCGLAEVEALKFEAYYASNGWRVGKNLMKSWHYSMAGWKLRLETERGQPQLAISTHKKDLMDIRQTL